MLDQLALLERWGYELIKNFLDFTVAMVLLLLLWPILLIIGICIKCETPGPVFFRQIRMGKGGKPFSVFKFRTMYTNKVDDGLLTSGSGDIRITGVGRIIRRWHLDEVVQLINVLRGEMSLVGPRPEVWKYVDLESPAWGVVLKCKPGITGLAAVKCAQYEYSQLSGKTAQQAEEIYCAKILPKKLRYDLFYFQAKSLSFDTLIVLWTLGLLLKRKGIANPL